MKATRCELWFKKWGWSALLFGVLLSGCTGLDVPDPEALRRDGEPMFDLKAAQNHGKAAGASARAQNDFGLKLLATVAAQKPRENAFVSPLSVWMALAMTEKSASGAAKTELKQVLALRKDEDASIVALRAVLKAQGLPIRLANALWAGEPVKFPPAFLQGSDKTFGAKAQTLDFRSDSALSTINGWVEEQTDGEIPTIIEKLPKAGAVLTNALYFRGRWESPFQSDDTQPAHFHGPKKRVSVPLMSGKNVSGVRGTHFEGAVLPYANSSCEMIALLPDKGKTPLDVVAGLSAAKLGTLSSESSLALRFPRFTLKWGESLIPALENVGVKNAFTPSSNWSALGLPPQSFLEEVSHRTSLKITEEGTVAAAATAVVARAGSPAGPAPKTLIFDRPFVVLLRETYSGALLFAGIVNDPQE